MNAADVMLRIISVVEKYLISGECGSSATYDFLIISGSGSYRKMSLLNTTIDYRLCKLPYEKYSINLIGRSRSGDCLFHSTIYCLDSALLRQLFFWQRKSNSPRLMKVPAFEALGANFDTAVTVAYTESNPAFIEKLKVTMLFLKAFRSIVDQNAGPLFIECTGNASLTKAEVDKNEFTISAVRNSEYLLGKTKSSSRGAEKFARLIGLKSTDFFNLRTLGRVYSSHGY
jgi:hypothetical protein